MQGKSYFALVWWDDERVYHQHAFSNVIVFFYVFIFSGNIFNWVTATDGALDLNIWIQHIPTDCKGWIYSRPVGKSAQFLLVWRCKQGESELYGDAFSSQPENLSREAALDASACFAAHHLLAHVLMQMLACEQGKSHNFLCNCLKSKFFLCIYDALSIMWRAALPIELRSR